MARVHRRLTLKRHKARGGYRCERRAAGTIDRMRFAGSVLGEAESDDSRSVIHADWIVPRFNDGGLEEVSLDDVKPDGLLALEDLLNLPFDNGGRMILSLLLYVRRWGLLLPSRSMPVDAFVDAIANFSWAADLEPSARLRELQKIMRNGGPKLVMSAANPTVYVAPDLITFLWARLLLHTADGYSMGRCANKYCDRYFAGQRGARRRWCSVHSKESGQSKSTG